MKILFITAPPGGGVKTLASVLHRTSRPSCELRFATYNETVDIEHFEPLKGNANTILDVIKSYAEAVSGNSVTHLVVAGNVVREEAVNIMRLPNMLMFYIDTPIQHTLINFEVLRANRYHNCLNQREIFKEWFDHRQDVKRWVDEQKSRSGNELSSRIVCIDFQSSFVEKTKHLLTVIGQGLQEGRTAELLLQYENMPELHSPPMIKIASSVIRPVELNFEFAGAD